MNLNKAITEFILDAEAAGLSPATIRWYRQRLTRLQKFLEGQGISDTTQVSSNHLRAFIAGLRAQTVRWSDHPFHHPSPSGLSPHTIHGYVRVIRRFFRWLVEEGIIEENPAKRLRLPRLPDEPPKAVTPGDLRRLLETARSDPRDYAVLCFIADTGCRVGGLVGLTLNDLDLEGRRAVVREKGRKTRIVFFGDHTRDALRRWLEARPKVKTNAVFVTKTGGQPLTTSGVAQILKRLAKRAGVTGRCNPHAFRHAFAREALKRGASLADVAQLLGHTDVTVTARFYARWADEELKERHDRFSPLTVTEAGDS